MIGPSREPIALSQTPSGKGRASTFRLLLDTAMQMIQSTGHIPSVADVAAQAQVSRATAYRCFASRSALVTAVIENSLGPVRTLASANPSGRGRVHELFLETFPRFKEFEPQLRAAAQLSLEHWALERAGLLKEAPFRRGHRVRILEHAIAPLAPLLRPELQHRLHRALSVVYGIESYIVLKDIWAAPSSEVERVALWMADALIDAALRDSARPGHAQPAPGPSSGGLPIPVKSRAQPTSAKKKTHMSAHSPAWLDEQYNNRARIPEHPAILQRWSDDSQRARAQHPEMIEAEYGPQPRERLDVFPATAAASPVLVYLHGGYWRALDKRDQSFIAPPFVERGAMVVLPDYGLCPSVTIEQIVLQTVQALVWVHRHAAEHGGDPERIVVAGHSAGGQLAAMMLACDWRAVSGDLPADLVKSAFSISGVHDLRPLVHVPFLKDDLRLDAASARKLSPALLPAPPGRLVAVVGGDESEEFQRQTTLIAERWKSPTVVTTMAVAGDNHMTVLGRLVDPASDVFAEALRLLGLAAN